MFFGFAYPAAKGVRSIYVLDQQIPHNQNNVSPEDVEAALSLYIIVEYWLRIFLFLCWAGYIQVSLLYFSL